MNCITAMTNVTLKQSIKHFAPPLCTVLSPSGPEMYPNVPVLAALNMDLAVALFVFILKLISRLTQQYAPARETTLPPVSGR